MKNFRISVAIPVYNEESYIVDLLTTVNSLNFPKKNLTVCIANNKSTDNTLRNISRFSGSHRDLKIFVSDQPVKGIGPTRKAALDNATDKHPNYLLTVDADCKLPPDLLIRSLDIINGQENSILTYDLVYPAKTKLLAILYLRPVIEVMKKLSAFQEHLLGPVFYTGCVLIPTWLYRQIYWDDTNSPIIPDDDYLLSRRFYAMGVKFLKTRISVDTSGRRINGNIKEWMQHNHVQDFRNEGDGNFTIPTKLDIKEAINKRLEKGTDRIIQSIVEYIFLYSLSASQYFKAEKLAKNAIKRLDLPSTVFTRVTKKNKIDYLGSVQKKYHTKVRKILINYVSEKDN